MLSLKVTKRGKADSLAKIRTEGNFPAVYYGKKETSTPVFINKIDFIKVWKKAGESSVISLTTDHGELEALIQEVDLDPVKDTPRHADFYVIEKGKKLKLNVPVEFTGTSEAVKSLGGILVKVLHELEIEALPKDLPHNIVVDISALAALDSQILAGSIALPAGVTLISGAEEVIASISVPKEEVEVAPVDISKIGLSVEKGKKEEEGAESAEGAAPAAEKAEKK